MGNLPLPEATSALFLVFGGNRTQAQKFFGRKSGKNNKSFHCDTTTNKQRQAFRNGAASEITPGDPCDLYADDCSCATNFFFFQHLSYH